MTEPSPTYPATIQYYTPLNLYRSFVYISRQITGFVMFFRNFPPRGDYIIFWGALTAEIMTVLCIPQRHITIISNRSCIELRNSFTRSRKQDSVLLFCLQTNFVPLLMIQKEKEAMHLNSHRTRISCIHQSLILVSSSGAIESISSSIFYSSSSLRNKSIPPPRWGREYNSAFIVRP